MEEQNTPNKKKTIAIVGVIAAVAIAVGFALFQPASTAPENPPQPTQSQFSVSESEKQEQKTDVAPTPTEDREATKTAIEDTGNQWLGGELSYDDAIRKLRDLQKSIYPDLVALAREKLAFIELEESCNTLKAEAENHITAEEYPAAFEILNSIDSEYSQYALVEKLYLACQDRVMAAVETPTSIEEFEAYISKTM